MEIDALFSLNTDVWRLLQTLMLTVTRLLALFSVLPFFGREALPGMLRNALVISLALPLLPVIADQLPGGLLGGVEIVMVLLKEILLGLMIGFVVGVVFWAASAIGAIVDTQRGAAVAGVLNPQLGDQVTPTGNLLAQAVAAFFFVTGGFLVLLEGIYQSYLAWPVFAFYPRLDMAGALFFLQQFDLLFYLGVFLAGPVVLAMFVAEFGMALINRFVPQLNVFVLAMPVKTGVGLFVLIAYFGVLLVFFGNELRALGTRIDLLDRVLR